MNQDQDKPLRFRCPHCAALMSASVTEAGTRRKCPKCRKPFLVPHPRKPVATQSTTESTVKIPRQQQLVPVVCDVCRTRMYATLDQVGAFMECPDCFSPNLVKPPPAHAKPRFAPAQGSGYDVGPEENLSSSQSFAVEMIAGAQDRVNKEIAEQADAPRFPFVTGVFAFPFYFRVFPIILGLTISLSIALAFLKLALDMQGSGALAAPFMIAISAVLLLIAGMPAMVCWFNIIEHTVQGEEDAEYRPDGGLFAFIDWAGEIFYLSMALTMSVVPGMFIGNLLSFPPAFPPSLLFGASLIFPVLLLSMMETASPLGFYSKPIWGSIWQVKGIWLRFYGLSLCLVAPVGAAVFGLVLVAMRPLTTQLAVGAVAMLYASLTLLTIYFRMLGRLGWVLIQEIDVDVEDPSDELDADGRSKDASKMSLGV